MKIDIVISDPKHPLLDPVRRWAKDRKGHNTRVFERLKDVRGGDALIMVACHEIARPAVLARYGRTFVTHASDLPKGRGWSPAVWTVLNGERRLTLSLIEAAEPVDSGRVYAKFRAPVKKTDLAHDVNEKLALLVLCALDFIVDHPEKKPRQQKGPSSWYRRRTPDDSRLDPRKSIVSQFDLLRISDPDRYPAFFDLHGQRFELVIRKPRK